MDCAQKRYFGTKALCPSLGQSALQLFVLMTVPMKPGLLGSLWFLLLPSSEPWFGCWRFEVNRNERWAVEVGTYQLAGWIKQARKRRSKHLSASTEQFGMADAGDSLGGAGCGAEECQGEASWGTARPKRAAETHAWPWHSICPAGARKKLHFLPY